MKTMIDLEQQKVDLHKFALSKTGACATYKKVESLADRLHGPQHARSTGSNPRAISRQQ